VERVTRSKGSRWSFLWKARLTRRVLVVSTLVYWLMAILWIPLSMSNGTFPLGLLWTLTAGFWTWQAVRSAAWMRAHEDSPGVLAEGARRTGALRAFVVEAPPWPIRNYRVDAFWVEVVLDGEDRVRSLPRYATDVYDDPRVRVGLPLELRVLGDEIAIDWEATLAAAPRRVPTTAGGS
jgi:hypothetical protein